MRQFFNSFLLAAALAAAVLVPKLAAAAETTIVTGAITWISADAVEVAGQRGTFGDGSDIRSDEHTVSWSSIRVGTSAMMETDAAGRVLELRVTGVVE